MADLADFKPFEEKGWVLVQKDEGHVEVTSETQGESRNYPGNFIAEKYEPRAFAAAAKITERASSLEQLIQQVEGYEDLHDRGVLSQRPALVDTSQVQEVVEVAPNDESGDHFKSLDKPAATVLTPEGNFTEEEWAARSRSDVFVLSPDEGTVQVVGLPSQEEATVEEEEGHLADPDPEARLAAEQAESEEVEAPVWEESPSKSDEIPEASEPVEVPSLGENPQDEGITESIVEAGQDAAEATALGKGDDPQAAGQARVEAEEKRGEELGAPKKDQSDK